MILIVSTLIAAPQSPNFSKPEGEQAASEPFDMQEQLVSKLIRLGGGVYLQRSEDGFGTRSHSVVERTTFGAKFYPLPQSSVETYRRLRRDGLNENRWPPIRTAKDYERQEVIGPYQLEGSRLWFGNQYYDGEGETGVGTFGYFDMKTRQYRLFSPPEIAHWEISSLLVEPDAVWLGLDSFVEDISHAPGGLVRWDRNNHNIRYYRLEFCIEQIRRDKTDTSILRLTTDGGYALLQNGEVQRFRVQKASGGKETAVRIDRFPPPPTHQ